MRKLKNNLTPRPPLRIQRGGDKQHSPKVHTQLVANQSMGKVFGQSWLRIDRTLTKAFWLVFLLLIVATGALAQEITDDQVNEIAGKMYCPVCENIPLDVCGTVACDDWREEIRTQLANGMTEEEVISDFVSRFGDRVVGTPVDPMLRALSLITPWIIGLAALLIAVWTVLRWRGGSNPAQAAVDGGPPDNRDDDYYRSRIEQDLQARR